MMEHRFADYDRMKAKAKGILFFAMPNGTYQVYDEDLETLRDFVGFNEGIDTDDNGNERRYLTIPPKIMTRIAKMFKKIGEPFKRVRL